MSSLEFLVYIPVLLIFDQAGCYDSHYRVPTPSKQTNIMNNHTQIVLHNPNNSSSIQTKYSSTQTAPKGSTSKDDLSLLHSTERLEHVSTWKQIQRVCGYYKMCYNADMYIGYSLMSTCCLRCSCKASCLLANNCCPDADITVQQEQTPHTVCLPLYNMLMDDIDSTDHIQQPRPNQLEHTTGSMSISLYDRYLTVNTCPPNTTNKDLIQQCHRPTSIYTNDHIPVLDAQSQILYKNIFCAQCHNATGYMSWELVTNCTSLYLMDSTPVYIQDIRDITASQQCIVYLNPSSSLFIQSLRCHSNSESSVTIATCNKTQLWQSFDPYKKHMCEEEGEMINAMSPYTDEKGQVYRNIYCYLCNIGLATAHSQTCPTKIDHHNKQSWSFGKFTASVPISVTRGKSRTSQLRLNPDIGATLDNNSCSSNFVNDVYMNKCIQYRCPLSSKALFSMCLNKTYKVTGLIVVGKLHIHLTEAVAIPVGGGPAHSLPPALARIQVRLTSYLHVYKHGCANLPGSIYGNVVDGKLHEFYWLYKLQNTDRCNVETVLSLFTKMDTSNIVLHPDETNKDGTPGFSVKMTYERLVKENFTFTVIPTARGSERHEVLLNASFYCQRVVLTVDEYTGLVDAGKLKPLDPSILQQEYTQDTGQVEVCLTDYLYDWFLHTQYTTPRPFYYNKVEVTLSVIATIISMLSITVVIITYCLFSDLRFVPGKLVMILCTNLLLAQAFYAFGLDLGIDNFWCKLVGICIHFFWLATLFSMNSILFLMLRSLQRPLDVENRVIIESRSITELMKYIAHCYTLPLVCVILNIISSSVSLTEQFGYGGTLCYIRTAKMRLITFGIPLAIVMVINFILFALIMSTISKYMKNVGKIVPVKQIFIFFKLITITGMYWLFGFLYEFSKFQVFSYLFIVFNAGQGFFLMWSFLYNSHIYTLYRTAIDKYMRKLREYSSDSGSTA